MPLYEYQCLNCRALTEKIQKFSDPPLTTCEKCGGELERLLSAPAIQFKGSGWYVTDYARKSAGPAAESADKSTAGSKSSDAGKSDGGSDSAGSNKSDSGTTTKSTEASKVK